jgi:hypothetical protein
VSRNHYKSGITFDAHSKGVQILSSRMLDTPSQTFQMSPAPPSRSDTTNFHQEHRQNKDLTIGRSYKDFKVFVPLKAQRGENTRYRSITVEESKDRLSTKKRNQSNCMPATRPMSRAGKICSNFRQI